MNSGHIPIQTICEFKPRRRKRPGLALLIAGTLSVGIILGQVWAQAQAANRADLNARFGITTQR